jgi:anti-sigma factor RsiW
MNSSDNQNTPGDGHQNGHGDYKETIMHWLDGDLDGEERASIEAGLQQQAESAKPGEEIHDVVGLLRSSGLMGKTALYTDVLMRWLDGEMSGTEQACFLTLLEVDEQLSADAAWMRQLSGDIRRSFSMEVALPRPEEFNREILDKIAQLPPG